MLGNGPSAHSGTHEDGWKVVQKKSPKKRYTEGRVQGWPTIPLRARMDSIPPTSPFDSRRRDEENSRKVFVGSLSEYTTSADLWEFFEAELGKVQDAKVIYYKDETGKYCSKGFGFVQFEKQEAANKALSRVHFLLEDAVVVVKTVKTASKNGGKMEFGREDEPVRSTSSDSVSSRMSIHPHAPDVQLGNDSTQKPPASHVVWTGTQMPPASSVAEPARGGTHPYMQLPALSPQSRGQYLPPSTRVPTETSLSREYGGPPSQNVQPSYPVKHSMPPSQYNLFSGSSPHHTSGISYEPCSFYNTRSSPSLHTSPSNPVADSRMDEDEEFSKLLQLLSCCPTGSSSTADKSLTCATYLHSEITSLESEVDLFSVFEVGSLIGMDLLQEVFLQ